MFERAPPSGGLQHADEVRSRNFPKAFRQRTVAKLCSIRLQP